MCCLADSFPHDFILVYIEFQFLIARSLYISGSKVNNGLTNIFSSQPTESIVLPGKSYGFLLPSPNIVMLSTWSSKYKSMI